MKEYIFMFMWIALMITGCGTKKNLETTAPFRLGEAYAQKWIVEDDSAKQGYEVIIPLMSLDTDKAAIQNVYHKGKMASLQIKLTEKGTMAIAEFGEEVTRNDPAITLSSEKGIEPFPFDLTDTQAVISYLSNKKVRYYKINGIQRNPTVSYPTAIAKNEW
ncbi:MAG: hypothetical protein HKN31_04055 [Pricia sp.]|nr:hypothetical protein [Pricia sp.]